MADADAPKVFFSYAWSSAAHEQWVLNLAERMVEAGVHVILDKWDLREGADTYQFMERIVNDVEIRKVVIISDKVYADKSNTRKGGAGTEAQIISPQLYSGKDEGRFALVLREKDEQGNAYVPTYYHGRIFIDMSTEEKADSNEEQLIRWIFDKPLHVRPALGQRPEFLKDQPEGTLGTGFLAAQFRRAVRNGATNSTNALREYLERFTEQLSKTKILEEKISDEIVVARFELLLDAKNELLQIILDAIDHNSIARDKLAKHVIDFFDRLLEIFSQERRDGAADHIALLGQELFISVVAAGIWREEFDLAKRLVFAPYFGMRARQYGSSQWEPFTTFYKGDDRFRGMKAPEGGTYHSPFGHVIKERTARGVIPALQVFQADFLLHLRAELQEGDERWYPVTWIYMGQRVPLESFVRAQSREYFDKLKAVLGIGNVTQLKEFVKERTPGSYGQIRLGSNSLNYAALMLPDALATRP